MRRGRVLYRASIVALALALGMAVMPAGGARVRTRSIELAPGVIFTRINDPRGPWSIRVVSIALAESSTIEPVLATGKLAGFERTSVIARRYGALAAINGDYARPSGRPVMTFAQDGELAQTELTFGVNFAVDADETQAYIKHQVPDVWLQEHDSGAEHQIAAVNAGLPAGEQLKAFTSLGTGDEPPPTNSCNARIYPTTGPRLSYSRAGVEQPHVVNEVICKSRRLWPKGGRTLSAPVGTLTAGSLVTGLTPGDDVTYGWSMGWPNVLETIGGLPTLVRDGELFVGKEDTPFFNRHPRTGVGFTAPGPTQRVLFVTVDGRQPGYSRGMTPLRFAKLFQSLGATHALNLDGGGSTTMVVNRDGIPRIVNRPSDGTERSVSSALLLLPGPDPYPTTTPGPIPTVTPTPSATSTPYPSESGSASPYPSESATTTPSPSDSGTTTSSPTPSESASPTPAPSLPARSFTVFIPRRVAWSMAAHDPASTGGLAFWLQQEGFRLDPALTRAATLFTGR